MFNGMNKGRDDAVRQRRSPKLERALGQLREQIEHGAYPSDELLPPERAMAQELGINRQTLRKILLRLAMSGHLEHIPSRGHRVCAQAKNAIIKSREKIACVFYQTESALALDTYYGPIFSCIVDQAEVQGNWLTQALSAKKPIAEIADLIESENIRGIISLGIMHRGKLKQLQSLGIPLVSVDYAAEAIGIDSIIDDDFDGAYQACKLLTQLGHTKIAYIGMVRGNSSVGHEEELSSSQRQRGYAAALKDAGLTQTYVAIGGSDRSAGERCFNELHHKNPEITGYLCFQDQVAVGVMRAARQQGLQVPDDISVIGFGDDQQLHAVLDKPLSTVRTGTSGVIAAAAIDCLRQRLHEPLSRPRTLVLPCELIVRQTTARCRQD